MAAAVRESLNVDSSHNVYVGTGVEYEDCTSVKIYFTGQSNGAINHLAFARAHGLNVITLCVNTCAFVSSKNLY